MLCLYVSAVDARGCSAAGVELGKDLTCRREESAVEGRRESAAIELLRSDTSSSSITLLNSVLIISNGGGLST